jgi:peptide-methionine (S)-S-oxide reductase
VWSTAVGYAGGYTPNPSYEEVCSGLTGHTEVVRVVFDPAQLPYVELLRIFWENHDPTQGMRQGNDVGTQYRSVILYADEEQKREAEAFLRELRDSGAFPQPVVTELKPVEAFYEAEPYHQQYYQRNTSAPYCQFVITPKMGKFRKHFAQLLKPE